MGRMRSWALLSPAAQKVAHETGDVHPHEGDERAEIEEFGAQGIGQGECADEREGADQDDVVARNRVRG